MLVFAKFVNAESKDNKNWSWRGSNFFKDILCFGFTVYFYLSKGQQFNDYFGSVQQRSSIFELMINKYQSLPCIFWSPCRGTMSSRLHPIGKIM